MLTSELFLFLSMGYFLASVSDLFVLGDDVKNVTKQLQYSGVLSKVNNTDSNPLLVREYGLEWLALLTSQKGFAVANVSSLCLSDMKQYWKALERGEEWASKIYDSNGRYAGQYLFGNDFWLGSASLCNEVLTQNFNVSFRVAKLHVSLPKNITSKERIVLMGLCQPKSCSGSDSRALLEGWISRNSWSEDQRVAVLKVRLVPGDYSVLNDIVFQIIGGIVAVVLVLVILSTAYEKFFISNVPKNCQIVTENTIELVLSKEKSDIKTHPKENAERNCPEKQSSSNHTTKEWFLVFSAIRNGRQIVSLKAQNDSALKCIHGLRVFSLTWVILVHTYLQLFAIGGNKMVRQVTERSLLFRTVGNASFSVDSFFFISGVLVAYLYKSSNSERGIVKSTAEFLTLILYRFVRLTPIYLLVLGLFQLSMAFVHNNSVFEPNNVDHENCAKFWWRNLLYINNFYPRAEMCMLWSWYLAADTQFFTLSALILVIAKSKFKLAAGVLGAIILSAWATTAFVAYTNNYIAKLSEPFGLFDELYDKPWTRIGPYIVGMAAGHFIKHNGQNFSLSWPILTSGWCCTLSCLLSLVYGLGPELSTSLSVAYVSLGHTAWGLCLAWIFITCQTGHGGIVNKVLSWKAWCPLSRLTFCAYLVHPVIMVLTSYVMDGPFHIHNGMVIIIFLGNAVASFLASFLLSLGFESPVVRLLKLTVK